jgi:hypothetical protein
MIAELDLIRMSHTLVAVLLMNIMRELPSSTIILKLVVQLKVDRKADKERQTMTN